MSIYKGGTDGMVNRLAKLGDRREKMKKGSRDMSCVLWSDRLRDVFEWFKVYMYIYHV